jgi:thiol-disulfide isomerase/thioredoxin
MFLHRGASQPTYRAGEGILYKNWDVPMFMKMFVLGAMLLISPCVLAADKPFDSKRDAEQDLRRAVEQASAQHKNIFVDFGGNWCPPCVELDEALRGDPNLTRRLEESFVVIHVDVGGLFPNKAATRIRKQYPRFKSVPHVLILTSDGKLLHDEVRGDFLTNDNGKGYSHKVLARFLDRWAPQAAESASK